MDFSTEQTLLAVGTAIGIVGGILAAAKIVVERVDARRARKKIETDLLIHNSIGGQELSQKANQALIDNLIAASARKDVELDKKDEELEKKSKKIKGLEKALEKAALSAQQIYEVRERLRGAMTEIGHLNMMVMDEETTKAFVRRFGKALDLLREADEILPLSEEA